ncbi:hypothetical protein RVR_3916 [Actinacidiphila reveromycinica]|uniref:DUF6571 domain-containing protein n=1 Tax=Actinacidiphila reveromycinica TaxID=659352 RepID=A0A7U3VNS1_9ACTN|nr:DUF6571 family protein [Streptomyces sp. SN-593]BBA97933.1 hypothetical protein RVR_3916 [Streptomyces sp. SN-593]
MGEFSGIDPDGLQKMTSSFKGDKDHLRSTATSYKSQFAAKGLDTSSLTQLVGICGWLDDQMPMLTRRYHLAIAADKPYPDHKGMVSVDDGMVNTTAQSQKDGKALADKYNDALKKGDDPSEDLFADLSAHADDPDYLKAFYQQLGPQNLMILTNDMSDDNMYSRYGDHPDEAKHDRDVIAKTFGTFTKVAYEGQSAKQKQASWDKWFDKFKDPRGVFRADYLTGLLPGGSQDKDYLVALGDRVFDEDPSKNGSEFMNSSGLEKGVFADDHYTQLFDAMAKNPEASGEWMDHNYDTLQTIIYPHGPWDLGQPPARAQAFADLMSAGTIDLKKTNRPLAEKLTARIMMDNYRHQSGDASKIHPYDPIDVYYGKLVTANWSDMVYGITSPNGNTLWGADATSGGFTEKMSQWDQKAFLAGQDPNRPGLEVGAPLWQALLNESARNPTVAGQESALFDAFRTQITNEVGSAQKDTTEHAQDYRAMQRGLMMKAYSSAFEYAKGSIETDADDWAESVNSARTAMIGEATKLAEGVATGGTSAILDLGTEKATELGGTATDLLTDYIASKVAVSPEDAPGLAAKYKQINDSELDVSWQHEYQSEANAQLTGGGFSTDVTAPVTIHPRNGPAKTYTGDPKGYIKAPADNFLTSGGTVMDIDKMTPRQRTAYTNWLMDPAVVNHVDSRGFTQGQQFQHLAE